MQIRKHLSLSRQMAASENRSSRWIWKIFLIAPIVVILLALLVNINKESEVFLGNHTTKSSSATKSPGTMERSVRFESVPAGEDGVLRYSAKDDDTGTELSMEDFIRLISNPGSSNLAKTMTTILKVHFQLVSFCISKPVH